jgi:hypothetical protein
LTQAANLATSDVQLFNWQSTQGLDSKERGVWRVDCYLLGVVKNKQALGEMIDFLLITHPTSPRLELPLLFL